MTNGFHKGKASPAIRDERAAKKSALATEKKFGDAAPARRMESQQNNVRSEPSEGESSPR